ncbi:MAG: hypothetical protein IPM54_34150 [Polyangiaceae bacterium]|nr:hypothetical protein [Polyangiaceae bacterium]
MARRKNESRSWRHEQRDQETAERLTFLEKLVLRVLQTRQVPKESGVQFSIGSKAKDDGICLVFQVDDPRVPIVEHGPRPDYLVVYVSRLQCIFTIIEMKGREGKNTEHGIDQIRAFAKLLREEMAQCLPGSWRRALIQRVLLTPFNSQINLKKIEEARKDKVEILPLQYHHQAELYRYISAPVSRSTRYAHEKLPRDASEFNPVEKLIAHGALGKRMRDAFFRERRGADGDTFFLNFRRPGDSQQNYFAISANSRDAVVAFPEAAVDYCREVKGHLQDIGLTCPTLQFR